MPAIRLKILFDLCRFLNGMLCAYQSVSRFDGAKYPKRTFYRSPFVTRVTPLSGAWRCQTTIGVCLISAKHAIGRRMQSRVWLDDVECFAMKTFEDALPHGGNTVVHQASKQGNSQ
jgi:hypothetical protein